MRAPVGVRESGHRNNWHFSHFLPLHPTINKQGKAVKGRIANFLFYDNNLRRLVDNGFYHFSEKKYINKNK